MGLEITDTDFFDFVNCRVGVVSEVLDDQRFILHERLQAFTK